MKITLKEALETLKRNGYLVESNDLSRYVALVKQYLMKKYTEDDISIAVYPGYDNESVVVLSYFKNIPKRYRWEYSWNPSDNKVKMTLFASDGKAYNNGHVSGIKTIEDFYAVLDKYIEAQFYENFTATKFGQEAENIVYSYGVDEYGLDADQIEKIMEEASKIKDVGEQSLFIHKQFEEITGLSAGDIEGNKELEAAIYDMCKAVYDNNR